MATIVTGTSYGVDMDALSLSNLLSGVITTATSTTIVVDYGLGDRDMFFGSFSYDRAGDLSGGVLNHVQEQRAGALFFDVTGFSVDALTFVNWVYAGATVTAFTAILAGADQFKGSPFADRLHGVGGNDSLDGGGGADTLFGETGNDSILGGAGNDLIFDSSGANYLRGDDGDDQIQGGSGFDDINGNVGNDIAHGADGDDWVVGGKDNDQLFGDAGFDIVYGNLGNDTVSGGDGVDWVRGGQGEDSVSGGNGDDWVWGDRGSDTLSGGAGADIFHSFSGAGIDRVIDFSVAQGDRVQLDPGSIFTVKQVGGDTVVDLGGGDQVVLVGVTMSSLPSGAVFVG